MDDLLYGELARLESYVRTIENMLQTLRGEKAQNAVRCLDELRIDISNIKQRISNLD